MRSTFILIVFLIYHSLFQCSLFALDTKLIIFCKSDDGKGFSVVGELLSVRESALVLRTEPVYDSAGMSILTPEKVCLVPLGRIDSLIVRRPSVILQSAMTGLAIGGGLGAALGYLWGVDDPQSGPWFYEFGRLEGAAMGLAIGGGFGMTLGLLAGAATPVGDELLDLNSKDNMQKLKRIARYQRGEPERLQETLHCIP